MDGVPIPDWLWAVWRFVTNRATRYVVAWLVALTVAGFAQNFARHSFSDANHDKKPGEFRRDGNSGHTTIDFGGQWLMGRMLVRGYGREMYDRNRQAQVAAEAYSRDREAPLAKEHDADTLLGAFMECDMPGDDRRWGESYWGRQVKGSFASVLMANDPLSAAATLATAQQSWTGERLAWARTCDAPDVQGWWDAQEARRVKASFGMVTASTHPLQAAAIVAAGQPIWVDRSALVKAKRVGGPLYPPLHAFAMALLAMSDDPQWAYFVMQWVMLAMAFVTGAGVSYWSGGRFWCPLAAIFVILYPGFAGAHHLGQNAPLSLALLVWGWALALRGRETLAGFLWGLLVYKPVWFVVFLVLAIFTGRWRMTWVAVVVAGAACLATLPVIGLEPWFDWLRVGSYASDLYKVDTNWVFLSRDLFSIPARFLVDFEIPTGRRYRWFVMVASRLLWLIVLETTLRVGMLCGERRRQGSGPAAAFFLLAAWMGWIHFMYYDALLSAIGVFALLTDPRRFTRPRLLALMPAGGGPGLSPVEASYFRAALPSRHPDPFGTGPIGRGGVFVANSLTLTAIAALIGVQQLLPAWDVTATFRAGWRKSPSTVMLDSAPLMRDGKPVVRIPQIEVTSNIVGPPWDTFVLITIWVGCGVWLLRNRDDAEKWFGEGQSPA
jgi:hypothetical protein